MNLEKKEIHDCVREGYQILSRMDFDLLLPTDYPRLTDFYTRLADTCLNWQKEVPGEELKREFSVLQTVREKARFGVQHYRFRMRIPWEEGNFAAILCETELTGRNTTPQNRYRRIAHVWNLSEQTAVPYPQFLKSLFPSVRSKACPFSPDGVYPEGQNLVFFRNPTASLDFTEQKLPV